MPTIVSLRSVSRTYRSDAVVVAAVRDVSFDIRQGEILAIMGPSGSGKSTLMHMIGLLDQPSEGHIYLEGAAIADLSDDQRSRLRARKLGFVFQSYNLLPRYSALENVSLPLLYGGFGGRERLRRAGECLHAVGMSHRAGHFPKQLSGGEQQRVAIARSLACGPAIILADEPTGALDSRTGDEILRLFAALAEAGQTVVIVTHDARVADQCKRVIRLLDGHVVADQAIPQAVKKAPGSS